MKNILKMKTNLIILVLALVFVACNDGTEKVEDAIRPVKYAKVGVSKSEYKQTFPGIVKAENETNMSFKVSGVLRSVPIEIGDKVKKGQLLASIDPVDYTIQKEKAIAQKTNAESQLLAARSAFQRIEKLYENNSVSLSDYEKAKANLASAESQYKAASEQYKAAINQVDYTQFYSPDNGTVTALMVEPNEMVGAGKVIAVISSDGNLEVEVGVPESMINNLIKGQAVLIDISSLAGQSIKGRIKTIANPSGSSSTYLVRVSIDNPADNIRPGMAANVSFIQNYMSENSQGTILVPIASVGMDSENNYVFVLHDQTNGNYRVEKRAVVTGSLLAEGFEIESGLKENELVATAGLSFLRDSMIVCLLNE